MRSQDCLTGIQKLETPGLQIWQLGTVGNHIILDKLFIPFNITLWIWLTDFLEDIVLNVSWFAGIMLRVLLWWTEHKTYLIV